LGRHSFIVEILNFSGLGLFFIFKIVFIYNFFKIVPIWVGFSPGLLQEQDFPERYLITADHVGEKQFSVEKIAPAWFLNSPELVFPVLFLKIL
jgi:hypothetical protein